MSDFALEAYNQIPDFPKAVKKCIQRISWHTSKTKKEVYALASEDRIQFAQQKLHEALAQEKNSEPSNPTNKQWKSSQFWLAELKRREKDYQWATAHIKKMENPILE